MLLPLWPEREQTMGSDLQIKTSVIIITYNGRHYLQDCLGALCPEIDDAAEIIVIDNNSSDGSPQYIRDFYPAVRLVVNPENRGFAAANNQGAALAAGDVLLFLNQDTRVYPGWLNALSAELARDDAVGLATSCLLLMDRPRCIHLCGQDLHYTGLVSGRGYGQEVQNFAAPAEVNAVSGGSFAIRRDLWQALGGFDETFFMYYEETDLSWRARLAGFRSVYVPGSRLLHDYQPASPGRSRLYHTFRNRHILLLKNWRCRTIIFLLPALILTELLEIGYALMNGWTGLTAKIAAYAWLITHPRAIRRLHQDSQKQRQESDAALLASLAVQIPLSPQRESSLPRSLLNLANAFFELNWRVALRLLTSPGEVVRPVSRGAQL
jgi:GT2 family glycosyltransferase